MLIAGSSHRFAPGNWAWPAGLVVWGPGHRSSPHAHHARSVPAATVGRWRRVLRAPAHLTDATVRAWFESAFSDTGSSRVDARVAQVVRALRARWGDLGRVSLPQLAATAGLSPSRFAHLFTESIGIPVRRYLLWLRVQRAAASLLAGQTIADAAYGAGFSDGAHLARTFRRMLGTAPSDIVRRQASARDIRIDHRFQEH